MYNIRVKKSFTLIELMLVIILISASYLLIFSNSSFKIKEDSRISLENIREFLLKNYQFENRLSLVCIEDKLECYIVVDDNINSELKIKNLFNNLPEVYEYKDDEEKIVFESIRIDDISRDVFFRLDINSDYKINELILDTLEDRVYVFNSLFAEARVYESLGEVFDEFERLKEEVKDAF